jgi:hypothetical protein
MKFLLDENLPTLYRTQLVRLAPSLTVWMIGDPGAPDRGTQDPVILDWCDKYGFILVTNNRASMPGHLANHLANDKHVPGILVFRPKTAIKEILDDLILITELSDTDEFRDQIVYIPL